MTYERLKRYRTYKKVLANSEGLNNDITRFSASETWKIETYINSISDIEIRAMAMKHFILGETYIKIGREFHCDRKTVERKIKRYIESCP